MSGFIAHTVPVSVSATAVVQRVIIFSTVPVSVSAKVVVRVVRIATSLSVVTTGAIFAPSAESVSLPTGVRQRYPAIPAEFLAVSDIIGVTKLVQVLRERVEIFSRDRGRVEDSLVRVEDLIELGLIKPEDVKKLNIR